TRLDDEIGRINEGFETGKPEAIELHCLSRSSVARGKACAGTGLFLFVGLIGGGSGAARGAAKRLGNEGLKFAPRQRAFYLLTIDEEGRCRADAEFLCAPGRHVLHVVEDALILHA